MAALLKALRLLGDEGRLRILLLLDQEELNVVELQEILGMGQSRISMALSQLKQAELVEVRRVEDMGFLAVRQDHIGVTPQEGSQRRGSTLLDAADHEAYARRVRTHAETSTSIGMSNRPVNRSRLSSTTSNEGEPSWRASTMCWFTFSESSRRMRTR